MYRSIFKFTFYEIAWIIIAFLMISIAFLLIEHQEAPPYIILSEKDKRFRFALGSAALTSDFKNALINEVIPKIAKYSKEYHCNILQVVGHTDRVRVKNLKSNLDDKVLSVVAENTNISKLKAGSNIDLGMMRALAVTKFLKSYKNLIPRIKYIHPYSAGQIITPNHYLINRNSIIEDPSSRRVELRLTRLGKEKK